MPPLAWHFLTGRPESLKAFADRIMGGLVPPPLVEGAEYIPPDKPFVTILNHYEDQDFAAWWGALLVAQTVSGHRTAEPRQVHVAIASEWWYRAGFGRRVKQPVTRLLIGRAAKIYGLIRLPPVLEGDLTRGQGVAGVREALALTRGPNPQLVEIAPEGHAGPCGRLKEPPPGAGLFLLLLTHDTIPCLPVGWYPDEEKRIVIRFGRPFMLSVPRMKDREVRDRAAAEQAMIAIGRLLPERLWGAYRDRIAQSQEEAVGAM